MQPHQPERNASPGWPGAQAGPGWSPPGNAGWQPAGGQPYGQAPAGGPVQPYGQVPPGAGGYPPPPRPPRRSSGTTVAVVGVILIVAVGALAAVGIFLYSQSGDSEYGRRVWSPGRTRPWRGYPEHQLSSGGRSVERHLQLRSGRDHAEADDRRIPGQAAGSERSFGSPPMRVTPVSTPSGSFAMRGSFTGGSLELRGERSISRPDGYR